MYTRLRAVREARVLSQSALAHAAGINEGTIVGIERGHVVPRPITLHKLAAALGVAPQELLADPAAYAAARRHDSAAAALN